MPATLITLDEEILALLNQKGGSATTQELIDHFDGDARAVRASIWSLRESEKVAFDAEWNLKLK
ncbi:MAG TPA: hypothetical protein V6D47_17680 [Oscillatoriaceae cyanobacterium]